MIDPAILDAIDTPLKFASLGVILMGSLAWKFFGKSHDAIKLIAFVLIGIGLVLGAIGFTKTQSSNASVVITSECIEGDWVCEEEK